MALSAICSSTWRLSFLFEGDGCVYKEHESGTCRDISDINVILTLVCVVVVVVHPLLPLLQLGLGMEGLSTGFRLEAGYIPAS